MKQINITMLLIVLMSMVCIKASAYDFEENGFCYNIISIGDLTCEVTKSDKHGDLVIPAEAHYQGRTLKVVRIGDEAFYNCSDITSLTIEEGVEEIGDKSFTLCKGITQIIVPNSLKIVGTGAFGGCDNVERIDIKSLESWCKIEYGGDYIIVDYNEGDVSQYGSPMGGSSNKANLYLNNQLITEVEIPTTISEIKAKTFFNLRQIKRVNLHSNITKIGLQAFYKCQDLETIDLPSSSIVSIDAQAFDNCISLEAIDIPTVCKEIGDYAFRNCKLISDVQLHEGLEKLGQGSFQNCTSLKKIVIPSTINELPLKVFDHCYLNKVVLSPSDSSIYLGINSLGGTTSIEIHRPFNMYNEYDWNATFYNNTRYKDPENSNSVLKEIVIGKEVSEIKNKSFYFDYPTSVIFEDSDIPLKLGYKKYSYNDYGGGIDCAPLFGGCIENLYLGRVLKRGYTPKYDKNELFGYCFSFKSITIGNQLDNDDIYFLRLSEYKELEDLTIGERITSIPDMSSCDKLDTIVVYGTNPPTAIGFANKTFLDCQLYVPYGCKDIYMNADVWKNFWNISEMDYTPPVIPITVTVKSYTRPYGDENPEFEYTVEGGELKGAPAITCSATKESPVGEYAIEIAAGSVENFNVTYVAGTLTVEKAPLNVIANDCQRVQFEENPVFTLRYEGFVNGDTEDVLTVKPTASTSATVDSEAGEYEIVVFGGEAENYEFSYQSGTLTVYPYSGIASETFEHPVNVYSIQGVPVRLQTTSLYGLPRGVYIVEGRKVTVK